MSAGHNQDNGVLTIHASLRTKGGKEDVPAPHDIKLKIGMFADFLTPHQSDFYADGMPGGNFFKDFTISKGEKAVELNLSMDTLRGYLRDYEGHWDGYAKVLIQARTAYDAAMPAGSKSVTVKFAASRDADAIGFRHHRRHADRQKVPLRHERSCPISWTGSSMTARPKRSRSMARTISRSTPPFRPRRAMITARPAYPTRPTAG